MCHILADSRIAALARALAAFFGAASASFKKKHTTKITGARLLSPLTKTPFTSLRGGKITFKGDDLCCVPVLNNCGGPTYRSPLDFFTCDQLFRLLEDDNAFVLRDNDYRSLENATKLTFFLVTGGKFPAEVGPANPVL